MTIFAEFPAMRFARVGERSVRRGPTGSLERQCGRESQRGSPQPRTPCRSGRAGRLTPSKSGPRAPRHRTLPPMPERWPLLPRIALHAVGALAGWLVLAWSVGLV